jgi:DNA-binding HxlR family transcriptional regulator
MPLHRVEAPGRGSQVELVTLPRRTQLAAVTTYGQFCPVALGAEIFAERWTPLILRELLMGGRRFCDIQRGVPRISRNLLTQRLESLRSSGIIERLPAERGHGHEYRLTIAGRELGAVIDALGTWGYRWASKDLTDEHLDPDFLMWALRRMVRVDALPDERVVLLFRFRRHRDRLFWLVLQPPEVDLCLFDPGYEVSLEIDAEVEALARVCLGHAGLLQVMRSGDIEVHGAPHYRNALPSWLGVTRFAGLAKTASTVSR